ncbi:MAG TPA: ATP-binding protein [Candidatus Kapabacteria bacterium]|nr:ATP-binding protein [Candidatus Kapabacteria bacterium]
MSTVKKKYKKSICIACKTEELSIIRDFVQFWAASYGFSQLDTNKITIAVDEVCSNLIKYGYKDIEGKEICIKIEFIHKDFIINITDDAIPFDLTEKPAINMDEYFEKFKKGGLGIHIVKSVMDEIKYYPSNSKDKKNTLRLTKQLL